MRSAEAPEQGKNRMRHAGILAGPRSVDSEPVALQISPHIATIHRALSGAIKTRCLHLAAAVGPGGSGSKSRRTNHQEPWDTRTSWSLTGGHRGGTRNQEPAMSSIVRKACGTSFAGAAARPAHMPTRLALRALAVALISLSLLPVLAAAQTAPPALSSLIVKLVPGLTATDQAAAIARNGGIETSDDGPVPVRLEIVSD